MAGDLTDHTGTTLGFWEECIRTGLAVCQESGPVHQRSEHQGPEGLDEPDEEDDPDGRGAGRALRAVESPQRDRRGNRQPFPLGPATVPRVTGSRLPNLSSGFRVLISPSLLPSSPPFPSFTSDCLDQPEFILMF
uniref:6-phosphofructo-2-kinase/fructose-2, 6-biphosphatase 4 n=1 Tax=Rousettus aegyptiacus TaxID=9407 RepID=A0A7J8HUB0_ROUAE|nr:6-phosphofructo-2-kinase/fructose-2,6-biphosphatase 4 [Rousettus aegyptiacus]